MKLTWLLAVWTLAPFPRAAAAPGVEVGEMAGAAFRIDMPAQWNGVLLMYCHGYNQRPVKFDEKPRPQVQGFVEAGYAMAQSGYSKGGWAVREALEETEALRQYFIHKHGRPKRTFVLGHSMGGVITVAAIETMAVHYDGALPMCGPLGPSIVLMGRRMFDTLVMFDYLFPGAIGSPVKPAPDLPKIQQALTAEPAKAALMTRWMGLAAEKELAGVVAFFASIQKEMLERAGGNSFDNRNTLYSGTDDDAALNRGVRRYASDPAAAGYLRAYHTPTGKPARPVLSLHTTYDQLVPASMANPYGEMVQANGFEANYVQRFVARGGHCRFEPGEMLRALEDLRKWVETGARPEAGEQK